jgi:hypothetical protein
MAGVAKKGASASKTQVKDAGPTPVLVRDSTSTSHVKSDDAVNDTSVTKVVQTFAKDWAYLYANQTLAMMGADDRNAKFLAVNHVAIPCKQEDLGDKAVPVSITLLKASSVGYGVAPYARNQKKGTETKKLFEMIPPSMDTSCTTTDTLSTGTLSTDPTTGTLSTGTLSTGPTTGTLSTNAMRLWSYEKKSMARGPRCDDLAFELHAGDTLIYFVSPQTFEGMKMDDATSTTNALPIDIAVIPEMSLLEITISPKSRESCLAGSGVRVMTIRIADPSMSMYSLLHSDMPTLPRSQREYHALVTARREKFPMLTRDLEESKAAFFLEQCPVTTFINDDNFTAGNSPMIQMVLGAGVLDEGDSVDITFDSLLKYTNTKNIKHACNLVECAAALGALRMFVAYNPFWGRKGCSSYRGIPLIDSAVFFAAVNKPFIDTMPSRVTVGSGGLEGTTVTAPTGSVYDSLAIELDISLHANAVDVADKQPVPTADFAIVGPGFAMSNAYNFLVNLRSTTGDMAEDVTGVFTGFFNVSSTGGGGGAGSWGGSSKFKRRKLESMV